MDHDFVLCLLHIETSLSAVQYNIPVLVCFGWVRVTTCNYVSRIYLIPYNIKAEDLTGLFDTNIIRPQIVCQIHGKA